MTVFTLIASFRAKPGHGRELVAALARMIEPSEAEAGCSGYRPMIDPARPEKAVVIERWQSEEALQAHFRTAHSPKPKPYSTKFSQSRSGSNAWSPQTGGASQCRP